jgi:AcrR family transcriptional regulator
MARKMPPGRLQQLVDCAMRLFIEQGYARTQIADVAEAMGIAKGTIYLYVESKEALFDLVVRSAAGDSPALLPSQLPLPTPRPGATLQFVRKRLEDNPQLPALAAALNRRTVADPSSELSGIVRELYRTLSGSRFAIKLMDRSVQFHPQLAALWFTQTRGALIQTLADYLERRIRRGQFRKVPDPFVAARVMMEVIVTWAVHRHWDPSPQPMEEQAVEDTVVQFIVGGLIKADAHAA